MNFTPDRDLYVTILGPCESLEQIGQRKEYCYKMHTQPSTLCEEAKHKACHAVEVYDEVEGSAFPLVGRCSIMVDGISFGTTLMHLEENYDDLSMMLEKINYQEYRWMVCGDFKMLTMLQAGYTKYPCFLYLWNSRARDIQWTKTDWSLRSALTPGEKMS
ncbi:hypothetical protein AVEN_117166-1 [Araneus ventricosus]|uniref:Uncharacterized protein n=1 Tax=Araneus ventricosus TaxID=182803 RepID=A0A4Y2AYY7_ARAVE|nr:hypothetical protein AVEN_117166-1 [Araneus ventricosus]